MYIIHMDIHQTNEQMEELENRIGNHEDPQMESGGGSDFMNKSEAEKKLMLRLELEFETIDEDRKDAMDVEEIKFKEQRMMKGYLSK